jgi:hypothetical protein
VTITGVTIRDGNLVEKNANGAGIVSVNTQLTLTDVAILNNVANANGLPGEKGGNAEGGGLIYVNGGLTMTDCRVSGNKVTAVGSNGKAGGRASGAGVIAVGQFRVVNTTISGNVADARGGQGPTSAEQKGGQAEGAGFISVQNGVGDSALIGSTVSGNVADGSAGSGGEGGSATLAGLLEVTNKTNVAIQNTTIAQNVARAFGSEGRAETGGLLAVANEATISVLDSTVASNRAEGPKSLAGNLTAVGPVSFGGSIVTGGSAVEKPNCLTVGTSSAGFNIDGTSECGFKGVGDKENTDPQLGPLQANGGPTETMAPALSSPAVDQGRAFGLSSDQRGIQRPIDLPTIPNSGAAGADGSDIGAVEFQPPSGFSFGKLTLNKKKGTATQVVVLPQPSGGTLTLGGNGLRAESVQIAGQKEVTLTIAATSKKLKKALRKKGKRKVGLSVTYAPPGNVATAQSRVVKLVKKRKKHKKHKKKHHAHANR